MKPRDPRATEPARATGPTSANTAGRRLAVIFAIAENGVIGRAGGLPWDYPEDRAFFLRTTRGHAVIMGRRTWEERGTPLPERTNIVVSRTFTAEHEGVVVARTLDDALVAAWAVDPEPFVIGGVRLFEEAIPRATRLYVTEVPGHPDGDTVLRFDRSPFRVVAERTSASSLRFVVFEPSCGGDELIPAHFP